MDPHPVLHLHIPEPKHRPGEHADFSDLRLPKAGSVERPPIDTSAYDIRDLAYQLIRVLDDEGRASGPWNPAIDAGTLERGLRAMLLTRAYDERMYRMQRQGKTSFYMKCTGEEAVAVAQAFALDRDDMCFPTYRQQGLLIARGWPILDMMCQVYSNSADPLKGRQLPIMYSSREAGFFSISGNLGTQYQPGGRLGDGLGLQGRHPHRGRLDRRRRHRGGRLSPRADLRLGLPRAGDPQRREQPVGDLLFQGIAGGEETTFASRGIGYGVPALRVDGNDFLAVYAVTQWAAERARSNLGPTLIELFTYRAEPHSTSDDPSRYRPADEDKRGRWAIRSSG